MTDLIEQARETAANGFRGQATADLLREMADEIVRLQSALKLVQSSETHHAAKEIAKMGLSSWQHPGPSVASVMPDMSEIDDAGCGDYLNAAKTIQEE